MSPKSISSRALWGSRRQSILKQGLRQNIDAVFLRVRTAGKPFRTSPAKFQKFAKNVLWTACALGNSLRDCASLARLRAMCRDFWAEEMLSSLCTGFVFPASSLFWAPRPQDRDSPASPSQGFTSAWLEPYVRTEFPKGIVSSVRCRVYDKGQGGGLVLGGSGASCTWGHTTFSRPLQKGRLPKLSGMANLVLGSHKKTPY